MEDQVFLSYIDQALNNHEKELISYVKYGRRDLMNYYLQRLLNLNESVPEVAYEKDRAFKNIFILSLGVISRTALESGIDYSTMQEMTKYFIIKIEHKKGHDQIAKLFCQMLMSFTDAVANIKKTPHSTKTVHKIQQIIFSRMYEKITPSLIAKEMNMSTAYLCRHFKKETGKTISTYINEVKIDEVKRLLIYTDKSILSISTQMGFSSPNYMSNIFKKLSQGLTPEKFRKLNYRSI